MPVSKAKLSQKTYVAIVLDKSGSMGTTRKETISGTNEQFSALRDSPLKDSTFVTLVTFNDKYDIVFSDKPAADLSDIEEKDYVPSATTAMYEAVGVAIEHIQNVRRKGDAALVVVISDGQNNVTRKYTPEQIASQILELQKTGWTFSYVGANQDLSKVQQNLGISVNNMLCYNSTQKGTVDMWGVVTGATRSYLSARSVAVSQGVENFTAQLYTEADSKKLVDVDSKPDFTEQLRNLTNKNV